MIKNLSDDFKPQKILICQQRQIGDVLLATPSIRLLSERFPDSELHFLTEKKCVPVLIGNPLITRIWQIDKKKGLMGQFALYKSIYKENFDLVIDFQQLIRLRLASLFSRANIRLSYSATGFNRLFYNAQSPFLSGYAAKAKSGVLGFLGVKWDGQAPEIHLSDEELIWAKQFLRSIGIERNTPFLTVDPTHRRITRKWPPEYYAEFIKLLIQKNPILRVIMLYGPGEKEEVAKIKAMAGNHDHCLVTEHMTSLREMCAIQHFADGHVGNCSSPRHFAVAVGTPSLTILGSTKPAAWRFPSDLHHNLRYEEIPCKGCNKSECKTGGFECLRSITPQQVFLKSLSLFETINYPDIKG